MQNQSLPNKARGQEADRNELPSEQQVTPESELIWDYDDRQEHSSFKRWLIVISLIGLFAAGYYWYSRVEPEVRAPVFFSVQQGDFTVKLTELGELRALDSATVSAIEDDPVIFLVPQGSNVKKGDVLVRFDATKYEVALEDSEAALKVAQADWQKAQKDLVAQKEKLLADIARFEAEVTLAELSLEELENMPSKRELARARLAFEQAQLAYKNAKAKQKILPELLEKGWITKNTLEEAVLDFYEARVNRQAALFDLERVKAGATRSELEKAKIRLQQAKYALEKAQLSMDSQLESFDAAVIREKAQVERAEKLIKKAKFKLSRVELRAQRDGIVVYARASEKSGDKVQLGMIPFEGQPLLYLPDLSTMVVDLEVDEFDISKVKVGSPVEIRPEAFPNTNFHGSVSKIGSLARPKQNPNGAISGVKVFDVMVMIEEKDPRLKPGLTVMVDIIADHQENVLFVPLSAVTSRPGYSTVFVSNAGNIKERKVVLGASNEHSVIVKKGLRPGEQLVIGHSSAGNL